MSSLSASLAAKIRKMAEDQLVQVVIFVRTSHKEAQAEEQPALTSKSSRRKQLTRDLALLLDKLEDRLQELSGEGFSPLDAKRHPLLGALSTSVPVSVLRALATDPLVEKIVEDAETSLSVARKNIFS